MLETLCLRLGLKLVIKTSQWLFLHGILILAQAKLYNATQIYYYVKLKILLKQFFDV